jgi:sulfatase modifying factor 1
VSMKTRTLIPVVAVLLAAFTLSSKLQAQPLVNIETVTVGDAGNAADTTGYGAVTNVFAIGKYEVTIGQYATFLNSVASVTSDSYLVNLWNPSMATALSIAGISRSGSGIDVDPYSYSVVGPSGVTPAGASSAGNRPIGYVSWFDAARFANWINNGATSGASTETGAYTLNGATNGIMLRNPEATWWIPTEDEWYKAAYYKGGGTNAGYWLYPTQSDSAPGNAIGSEGSQANYGVSTIIPGPLGPAIIATYSVTQSSSFDGSQNYLTDVGAFSDSSSAYGTFDQGGNLEEWNDAVIDGELRGMRGGVWSGLEHLLTSTSRGTAVGPDFDGMPTAYAFRVATVPEPSTYALLFMSAAGALWFTRKRRP